LGVLDINELNGRGFNGISATSKDTDQAPYTPARDLLFVFHQVMNESMKRTPNKEKFPLDERRRKACENFKLGGLAAQK
jgi:hypothetical protein